MICRTAGLQERGRGRAGVLRAGAGARATLVQFPGGPDRRAGGERGAGAVRRLPVRAPPHARRRPALAAWAAVRRRARAAPAQLLACLLLWPERAVAADAVHATSQYPARPPAG